MRCSRSLLGYMYVVIERLNPKDSAIICFGKISLKILNFAIKSFTSRCLQKYLFIMINNLEGLWKFVLCFQRTKYDEENQFRNEKQNNSRLVETILKFDSRSIKKTKHFFKRFSISHFFLQTSFDDIWKNIFFTFTSKPL